MAQRILLADDSLTIQKVVELTFSEKNYELLTVGTGDKALQAFKDFRPDLVMADVVMPGLTGYEVCEAVKNSSGGEHIPVILLTGTFEPFDRARAERVGCDSIVTKPFDSHALASLVADLLAKATAAKAAAPFAAAPPPPPPQVEESFASEIGEATAYIPALHQTPVEEELAPAEPEPAPAPEAFVPPPPPEPHPVPTMEAPEDAYATSVLKLPSQEEIAAMAAREQEATARLVAVDSAAEAAEPLQPTEPISMPVPVSRGEEPTMRLDVPFSMPSMEEPIPEPEPISEPIPEPEPIPAAEPEPVAAEADVFAEPAEPPPPPPVLMPTDEEYPEEDLVRRDIEEDIAAFERSGKVQSRPELWEKLDEMDRERRAPAAPETEAPLPAPPAEPELEALAKQASLTDLIPTGPSQPPMAVPAVLSDADVDRIARRVVELLGEKTVKDLAWDIVPELAERIVRARIQELEQAD